MIHGQLMLRNMWDVTKIIIEIALPTRKGTLESILPEISFADKPYHRLCSFVPCSLLFKPSLPTLTLLLHRYNRTIQHHTLLGFIVSSTAPMPSLRRSRRRSFPKQFLANHGKMVDCKMNFSEIIISDITIFATDLLKTPFLW